MDYDASMDHILKCLRLDPSAEPTNLPMSLLKTITNNFSEEKKIGCGGFAEVYQGVLPNKTVIAVKKLFNTPDMDEKKFIKEVGCLMMAKHKNIVQFLGYCSDTQGIILNYEGQMIQAEERQRLLCFEFLPRGSLDKYITDLYEGLQWRMRYKIIKGICEGLHYLHHDHKIIHSDLKPTNILLNENMVPKIADFGLARCFDGKQSKIIASEVIGTWGYLAPEFLDYKVITFKTDIYSLGIVIMEILTGQKGNYDIQNVLQSWSIRLKPSQEDIWLQHVQVCAEIGKQCIRHNPEDRPDTLYVIERLDEIERKCSFIETNICASLSTKASSSMPSLVDEMHRMALSAASAPQLQVTSSVPKEPGETSKELQIRSLASSESCNLLCIVPMELRFPFEPNKLVGSPVSLTNRTDSYVVAFIRPASSPTDTTSFDFGFSCISQVMEPRSTWAVVVTVRALQQGPPPPRDTAKLEVLTAVLRLAEQDIAILNSRFAELNTYVDFVKLVKELGREVVHRTMLTAVICDSRSPSCLEAATLEIISTWEPGDVLCVDLYSSGMPCILMGHRTGKVCMWNYKNKEKLTEWPVTREPKGLFGSWMHTAQKSGVVYSVRFIPNTKWLLAAGDDHGWIHIYNWVKRDKSEEFEAYRGKPVSSLVAHPSQPFLLSSSDLDPCIKLWDWDKGWACTRVFNADTIGLLHLTLNPRDTNYFAAVARDARGTTKIWDIRSSNPVRTLTLGEPSRADYFCTGSPRHSLVARGRGVLTKCANMWDLEIGKCVHSLGVRGRFTREVACHPKLPILATLLDGGTICIWDLRNYRLEKMYKLTNHEVQDLVFLLFNDGIARLGVLYSDGIALMKINTAR